jgi:hypothetical protein
MLSTICEAAVTLAGTDSSDTQQGSSEVQPQVGRGHVGLTRVCHLCPQRQLESCLLLALHLAAAVNPLRPVSDSDGDSRCWVCGL